MVTDTKFGKRLIRAAAILFLFITAANILFACSDNAQTAKPFKYNINYYIENASGGFSKLKTDSLGAQTNDTLTLTPQEILGYVFHAENPKNVVTGTPSEQTPFEFHLYYKLLAFEVLFVCDGVAYAAQNAALNDTVLRPKDPHKKGYKFAGWKNQAGADFDFSVQINADITLHAHWQPASESVQYAQIAAKWYYNSDDGEYIVNLGADKNFTVLKNNRQIQSGKYTYFNDGYIEANFTAGILNGADGALIDGMNMVFETEEEIAFYKHGYKIIDFDDQSDLDIVDNTVYYNIIGANKNKSHTTYLNAFNPLLPQAGKNGVIPVGGALYVEMEESPINDKGEKLYHRSGITVFLNKPLPSQNLVILAGVYLENTRERSDETIILYTADENRTAHYDLKAWYTLGAGSEEFDKSGQWMQLEISGENLYGGPTDAVSAICLRTFRDENFYLDYLVYYYR